MLPERFWVKKINLQKKIIRKGKFGTVIKVKLVTTIKKLRKLSFILELWY